ncbi:MAG: PDZ domain-containing protein [Deltaproteobacteria bacterium]|nr:MAG: PDZ domain-containing protein [Deltaproteobacteria bacterium]
MKPGRYYAKQAIKIFLVIITLLLLPASWTHIESATASGQSQLHIPDTIRRAVDNAVAAVKPAVVRIHVVTVRYSQGREEKEETVGSGVIITKDGHVITNHHVAGKAKRIVCTLFNKEEVEADLIGTDPLTDISVIKLHSKGKREFPAARFGDSSRLKVGDYVLAIGSPYALSQSVTMGIVSNTELVMPRLFWPFRFTLEGEEVGSIVRWIGHDASIYGGNSGGPLVNLKGEVVGINEISLGISGAIPGNLAKEIAGKLMKHGKVSRSWFGLELQPLLKSYGKKKGVLISGTIEGSPAEKAGFLPGDILLRIAGQKVSVRFSEELPVLNQVLMKLPVGEEIKAMVLRHGKEITLKVSSQEREYVRPKPRELKRWGVTVSNISLWAAREMKRKNQDGVLITTVRPGGPCGEAKPKIIREDVIMEVDGKPVKDVEGLLDITDLITEGKSEPVPVVVTFERKTEQYLTVVKVGTKKLIDRGLEARKAWLPVATQVLTRDILAGLSISNRSGVRITQVYHDSSAEKAGLKVGDLIVGLDGEIIPASEPEDFEVLPAMIRQYKIGSKVKLTVLRGNEEFEIKVKLAESPKLPREMEEYRDENFEFTVRDVVFFDRVREEWEEDLKGVLVEEVGEGGWAALAHLAVGDLILTVKGESVLDVASFGKIMKKVGNEKPKNVVFQVKRGIHNLFIELEPSWPE